MKLRFAALASVLMLVILFASCSKKAKVPVPKDAAIVIHINGASLNSKLSWDEVKQSNLYKLMYEEGQSDEMTKKLLDNPATSGIDIKSDAYIFVTPHGKGGYIGITCNITDEKAFGELVAKVAEGKEVKKDGDINVITSSSTVFSWSKDRLVIINDAPEINTGGGLYKGFGGSGADRGFSTDSLLYFAKNIYSLKSSSSIGANSKFTSMLEDKGDAHFWIDAGHMYGGSMPSILALTKASLLFDGNISATTLNFDNGKITIDGHSYYNKELGAIYKKYPLKNIDEDMLKKIPAGDVDAVMAFNYPPDGLKEFFSLLGVDGLLNMGLSQIGFSTDDFVKANKGDILLSVSDLAIKMKEQSSSSFDGKEYKHSSEVPDAKILFATSVRDKTAFEKLITILKEKIGSERIAIQFASKIPYQLKDNWFIAGNDSSSVFSFGNTATNHDFISKISGHPMAGYFDIAKIINATKGAIKDSAGLSIANESLNYWQDILFHGGELKDNALLSHIEINMVDKKTNSLKQLNKYFDFIATTMKKHRDEYRNLLLNDNKVDTATAAPVIEAPKK